MVRKVALASGSSGLIGSDCISFGRRLRTECVEEPRGGDHICCISHLRRLRTDLPGRDVSIERDSSLSVLAGNPIRELVP